MNGLREVKMTRVVLLLSSIYLALIGGALMIAPVHFGVGAVPADPPEALVALLRLLGGPFLGIAVLNWLSRNQSEAGLLRIVLIANTVGFGLVAANDVWGVMSGEAREIARIFLFIHAGFAAAFATALFRLVKRA